MLYPLINCQTFLSCKCSLLLYKQIIQHLLLYILFRSSAKTHINKIQVLQLKVIRVISSATGFVQNDTLHIDFKIPKMNNYIKDLSISLFRHLNKASGAQHFGLNVRSNRRRLQRGRPHDVLN